MEILYIGNALANHGKAPTTADILPQLLREEGHEVHVASSYIHPVLRFVHMLGAVLLHSHRMDMVIIDTYSTKNFYYAYGCSLLCRLVNVQYIANLHGGGLPQRMDHSPKMIRSLLMFSCVNISPTGFLKHEAEKRGFQAIEIPNSIELEAYKFKLRDRVRPRLLFVRAFARIYNPEMAIRVLARVLRDFPEAELCMVGPDKDGSLNACKELAKKLGADRHAQFTGLLSKKKWKTRAERCDIFINTTNWDNAPISVIEAMALGLPVVSTNPGGIPYLIEHERNGLLVDCGDVDEMAKQIKRLVEDNGLARDLAQNARGKVENYDWKVVRKLWNRLLNSKMDENSIKAEQSKETETKGRKGTIAD